MADKREDMERVRRYILENEEFFGPGGLGWPRPGGLPKYYSEHPDEWSLDLAKVERLKREKQAKDTAAARSDRTASTGMSEETRRLLAAVQTLRGEGYPPEDISQRLQVPVHAVLNALALGRRAHDPKAQAPAHSPEVEAFLNGFAKRSW